MPMTKEELMLPRYQICPEGYPDMPFVSEAIISLTGVDKSRMPHRNYYCTKKGDAYWYEPYFDRFPNIFIKLHWYDKRKIEDLPKYLSNKNDVYKVREYVVIDRKSKEHAYWKSDLRIKIFESERTVPIHTAAFPPFLPATESEYLSYMKSKNNTKLI